MKLNLGCGPHRARRPWINIDRVHLPGEIEPDLVLPSGNPTDLLAYKEIDAGNVTHVYLGHVLEHVPWDHVPQFLGGLHSLLAPDGQVCVVGPDVLRAIKGYREQTVPWSIVTACLEGQNPQIDSIESAHDGARHQWNAHEERVMQAMHAAGFVQVESVRPRMLDGVWPLVSPAEWQCAVVGMTP